MCVGASIIFSACSIAAENQGVDGRRVDVEYARQALTLVVVVGELQRREGPLHWRRMPTAPPVQLPGGLTLAQFLFVLGLALVVLAGVGAKGSVLTLSLDLSKLPDRGFAFAIGALVAIFAWVFLDPFGRSPAPVRFLLLRPLIRFCPPRLLPQHPWAQRLSLPLRAPANELLVGLIAEDGHRTIVRQIHDHPEAPFEGGLPAGFKTMTGIGLVKVSQ